MFAVFGLILWIAPFYIAWKLLVFSVEAIGYLFDRRRKRLADRPPREKTRPAVVVFSLILAVPIGYVLALLIAASL
ncbi:MAG TPA: hypothetical protein VIP06_02920 [Nocardioides sp.]